MPAILIASRGVSSVEELIFIYGVITTIGSFGLIVITYERAKFIGRDLKKCVFDALSIVIPIYNLFKVVYLSLPRSEKDLWWKENEIASNS